MLASPSDGGSCFRLFSAFKMLVRMSGSGTRPHLASKLYGLLIVGSRLLLLQGGRGGEREQSSVALLRIDIRYPTCTLYYGRTPVDRYTGIATL